ncbi:SHOCT domain-containing protein [Carnobacterium inhibens]|uniref:SHOCT domain-containing protein n=1 Tax=Carnobacterium inhibens TaxID=147709 RepID=A0ABR7TE04_9LACT|nr:SHOCT domain-containing protein [Carnobacterium inhibens]MBC9826174.1 SHOCT domain-containing protein [Carnobacterium inhibens]
MMNGGHMGNFSNGGYNNGYEGMQQGFNTFNTMLGSNLKQMIIVGLIFLVIYIFFKDQKRQKPEQNKEASSVTTAKEAAKLRYACGEITYEEFQSILEVIEA